MLMTAHADGTVLADHIHAPLLFTVNGAVFFADYPEHGRRHVELHVWEFSPERGHWLSLGRKTYAYGHKFRAVAERTRSMLLDGEPLPSAPDGNPHSPRKQIKPGMDRLTVDGQMYRWPCAIQHGKATRGSGSMDQTSFFAARDGAKEELVIVRDHDDITFG